MQFFPLDVQYKVKDDITYIYIYARTVDGEKICLIDQFDPYFYIIPKNIDIDKFIEIIQDYKIENAEILRVEKIKKNYKGNEILALKIYVNIPASVSVLSKELANFDLVDTVLEKDIRFTRKYLIDKKITPLVLTEADLEEIPGSGRLSTYKINSIQQNSDESYTNPQVLAIDIETYHDGTGIDFNKHPILMISFYSKKVKKVITWKKFQTNENVEFVSSESDLLERTIEIIEQINPDIITTYNGDLFDLPYLQTRAKKYNLKFDVGMDHSEINIKHSRAEIAGIIHVDLYPFIKRVMRRSLKTDSYTLNNVSNELLGEQKIEVDLGLIGHSWDNNVNLEIFAKYNLKDSELTYKLHNLLLPNMEELAKICRLTLFDSSRMSFSNLVESFLLQKSVYFNELAPNIPSGHELNLRMQHSYIGASVFEPTPGLYDSVVLLDFRSFWPSLIVSHNISPETINCDCCNTEKFHVENKDYHFCKNKIGFISRNLKELIVRRMDVKQLLKSDKNNQLLKARSDALKVLSNSFYGYLGYYRSRWYSVDAAKTTTGIGRQYIQDVMDKAEAKGFKVLYSDTDSVFLLLQKNTIDDALKLMDSINSNLPELVELEFEEYYPAALFVGSKGTTKGAKKRYALMDENGNLKVKGLELVRRNVSPIAKKVQEQVLIKVLKERNADDSIEYVHNTLNKVRKHAYPSDEFIITTKLTKPIDQYESRGPNVRVAERLQRLGQKPTTGTLIKYIVIAGEGNIGDRAIPIEEFKKGNYDYDADYYINNQILPAIEGIFKVFNYTKDDLVKKDQSKLSSFFG